MPTHKIIHWLASSPNIQEEVERYNSYAEARLALDSFLAYATADDRYEIRAV